ncbi:MAG: glutamate--tRNA ligase [Hyphomicrobium sp.]|nr:MAG: glutamate--tRNA ligase [Hyphomicrobium sp.]PPC99778.1 MAG: glutamate--tRNA ligase [Hyphomicrobium sp.]
MTPRVRFAPSPTGRIHIGNIRTAVLNWLYAKKNGGHFLLRLDDTDLVRSTEEFAQAIRDDLTWLGLTWHDEERQSLRTQRYNAAADELKASGALYPCFETEDELDRRRKRQLAMQRPPIYDRASLKLSKQEIDALIAGGRTPHWRFRLPNTGDSKTLVPQTSIISWPDLIRGEQNVDLGSLSDPVLIRADGTFLYTFTSVVDDVDFKISHIVRGEDHVTNTGVQMAIFQAMGAKPPAFGHHSLLIGADGHALSKRLGALSVQSFRDDGLEPMAVLSHAALVGTSDAIEPHVKLDELAALMSFDKISMAPGRFDVDDLKALNAKLLLKLEYADVAERLRALGIEGGKEFWEAVRGNLTILSDARRWWDVVSGDMTPVIEDENFTRAAAELLPAEPWDSETWAQWTNAVKAATGAKGKALFHPLRLALTGAVTGPELKALLPLIGRARTDARLRGKPL